MGEWKDDGHAWKRDEGGGPLIWAEPRPWDGGEGDGRVGLLAGLLGACRGGTW